MPIAALFQVRREQFKFHQVHGGTNPHNYTLIRGFIFELGSLLSRSMNESKPRTVNAYPAFTSLRVGQEGDWPAK
jgi:hypothetical protein